MNKISEEELSKQTVAQLKTMCAEKGIEIPADAKKADIIQLLGGKGASDKPKEEAKPKPKKEAETKIVAKEKKKEKGAKDKDIMQKFEDTMAKVGYVDIYDYITLAVGIWGMIWTVILFFAFLGEGTLGFQGIQGLSETPLTETWNNAWAALFLFIMMFWVYINLCLYPLIIDKVGMKIVKSKSFPLHFLRTKEDLRSFIVFLSFWSVIFFAITGWALRWPHIISLICLTFVILADPLSQKFKAMPLHKVREE